MVRGLKVFEAWFKGYEEHYVLIGGTAAAISMAEVGLPFRGTKDLDIVLHVELLTSEFAKRFWAFVEAGGYQKKEGGPNEKANVYRFQKPIDPDFPHMLELFSRKPDQVRFTLPSHLTPIPIDEQISSLSAILLDDDYYKFVLDGRRSKHGMPSWVGEDRLIPLKAIAWLEMQNRVKSGESIDSKKINKHLVDIVQLSGLLQPNTIISTPLKLRSDLQKFAEEVSLLNNDQALQAIGRIYQAYGLESSQP
jgi:hypothetical protein